MTKSLCPFSFSCLASSLIHTIWQPIIDHLIEKYFFAFTFAPKKKPSFAVDGRDAQQILLKESQSLQRSKSFYITEEYDILIQSLRNTNHFNENTNERRGLDGRALGTIGVIPDFMTRGLK